MFAHQSVTWGAAILLCAIPASGQEGQLTGQRNQAVLQRVEKALQSRVSLDFHNVPLTEVADAIGKKLGVPVLLDTWALADAGLDVKSPISFHQPPLKFATALEFILSAYDLTWVVRNEVLLITTRDEASQLLETRVYDVNDLLVGMRHPAAPGHHEQLDQHSLMDLVLGVVETPRLSGSASCLDGMLICSLTQEKQRRVVDLLARMREVVSARGRAWKQSPKELYVPPIPVYEDEAVHRILNARVSFNFEEEPLSKVMQQLSQKHQLAILIDQQHLQDAGIALDTPLTRRAADISLRSALDRLLHDLDLTWQVLDDALLITTVDEVGNRFEGRVYDVIDLVFIPPSKTTSADDWVGSHCDYDSLIDAITSTVAPTTWSQDLSDIGRFNGMIVCGQSQRGHESIVGLIEGLRAARRERVKHEPAAEPPVPIDPAAITTVIYKVEAPVRWQKVKKPGEGVSTKPGEPEKSSPPIEVEVLDALGYPDERHIQEVATAITATVEPDSWEPAGGRGVMRTVCAGPNRMASLVVRQTAAVHTEIRRFLRQLDNTGDGFGGRSIFTGGNFF